MSRGRAGVVLKDRVRDDLLLETEQSWKRELSNLDSRRQTRGVLRRNCETSPKQIHFQKANKAVMFFF